MMTMEAPVLRVLPPPLSPPLFAPGLEPLLTGCNATRQEEEELSGQVEVWEAVVVDESEAERESVVVRRMPKRDRRARRC